MDPKSIYLIQTDTTVGLVSQNKEALIKAKKRASDKPFIITCAGLSELKKITRVPKKAKKLIRRSTKTTFVYPHKNLAIRVVADGAYKEFLKPFGWMYSTSANESGGCYDENFAKNIADTVIENIKFYESKPSSIIKLGKRPKKLR